MSILVKQYLKIYVHIAVAMKIVTNTKIQFTRIIYIF